MAQVINTNVASLNAQRNLNSSQSALNVSLQRLSSGLRINSAKDDAAGLAISDRFTTQIRGTNQAVRNSQDGVSLSQTAESALGEITNNLQRIRELAVQSANATNSASDRAALDLEVQQRIAEVDRIASQTAFNGRKVLDGSFGTASFQVGANVGQTIAVNLATSNRTTAIGKTSDYVNGTTAYSTATAVGQQGTGVTTAALAAGDLSIAVGSATTVAVGASADNSTGTGNAGRTAGSAYSKALAINTAGINNLTATADTTAVFDFAAVTSGSGYTLTVNATTVYSATASAITGSDFVAAINGSTATTGVTASYDSGTNRVTLGAADGRDIVVNQTATGTVGLGDSTALFNNADNDAVLADYTGAALTFVGTIRLNSSDAITLSGNNETFIGYADGSVLSLGASALSSASVTSIANSNIAINRVDAALTSVSNLRSTFGAIQNRFESTIANLESVSENLTASRSRILDADFAAETAALTRGQILQQAGTAILSQANSLPNNVLSLLR